jgi:aspartate oxidase
VNPFSIEVYLDHGIDLSREAIEIQVAVQHCNGGMACDKFWASENIKGLFAIGELNGSHGQHRPGGAALNAGQVGGLQVARGIKKGDLTFTTDINRSELKNALQMRLEPFAIAFKSAKSKSVMPCKDLFSIVQNKTANVAGIVRNVPELSNAIENSMKLWKTFPKNTYFSTWAEMLEFIRCRDAIITQWLILEAMREQMVQEPRINPCYIRARDPETILKEITSTPIAHNEKFAKKRNRILLNRFDGKKIINNWEGARPVPVPRDWFEQLLKKTRDT